MTLTLPNGGLNLHTPTISVGKEINEVKDANCMLLTDGGEAMREQETGTVQARPQLGIENHI